MADDTYEPVRVHLAGSDVALDAAASRARKRRKITTRTIVLTSGSRDTQVQPLLGYDLSRVCAYVQATGADVVLCESLGDAQDAANTTTGLPHPVGALLPHANTAPTPLETTDRMWVASPAASSALVSLIIINEADA